MILDLKGVSKSFPGVLALSEVSISLEAGQIHGLIGENGAGKSTLIKIITGTHRPDSGTVRFGDRDILLASPREAIELGVSAVYQERNVVPDFSVAENVLMGNLPRRYGLVDYGKARSVAGRYLERVGLAVDPSTKVSRLSVAQMQLVEIARAISRQTKVLLLDEPTASLTQDESARLFSLVREMREEGVSILFVSHKLEEVLSLCDAVTVLRDGRAVLSMPLAREVTRGTLIEAVVGRSERAAFVRDRSPQRSATSIELRNIATEAGHENINLHVDKGEIVGLYGLVGAGRTELAHAIMGKSRITAGQMFVQGSEARVRSVRDAVKRWRIGYVTEDRAHEGLIPSHPIRTNIAITVWREIAGHLGLLSARAERRIASPLAGQLDIRSPSLEQAVGKLSGGNQQKVSLAKWLAASVDILIVDEPTVGIDIGTKAAIHELLGQLAEDGKSILVISSDMPEVIALADRIYVMNDFRIVQELPNDRNYETSSRAIMSAILRAHAV